jgi:hypothetical protein
MTKHIGQVKDAILTLQQELRDAVQQAYPIGCRIQAVTPRGMVYGRVIDHSSLDTELQIVVITTARARWINGASDGVKRIGALPRKAVIA